MGTGRSSEVATAYSARAVVVNTPFPTCRALYIGVTGDVTVTMATDGTGILFKAVPVGILPIQCTNVSAATATNIVALY